MANAQGVLDAERVEWTIHDALAPTYSPRDELQSHFGVLTWAVEGAAATIKPTVRLRRTQAPSLPASPASSRSMQETSPTLNQEFHFPSKGALEAPNR